jgi:hypothetical protein
MRLNLEHDPFADDPNNTDGWHLYSFCPKHADCVYPRNVGLSDRYACRTDDGFPGVVNPGLRRKLQVGLAYFLSYFEHSSVTWFRAGSRGFADMRWDGVRMAGLLVWQEQAANLGAKTPNDRAADADRFLEMYSAWANGWCYTAAFYDDGGNHIDGEYSYGGVDLESGVMSFLQQHQVRNLRVDGDAAWLAENWNLSEFMQPAEKRVVAAAIGPGRRDIVRRKR